MMELKIFSVLYFVALVLLVEQASCQLEQNQNDNNVVNGSFYWVVKIAEEACKPGHHDDEQTAKVFRCYSEVPGTEIFHGCQSKTFGHLLDSGANMDDFCKRWPETFTYYKCNQDAFAEAGRTAELPGAVLKLNLCQAKSLRLGQFAPKSYDHSLHNHAHHNHKH